MNIKVLSLESWMKYPKYDLIENDWCTQLLPKFNRDGFYCIGDECWFEYKNRAFTHNKLLSDFKYKLTLLNLKTYREIELKAIETLIKGKVASRELVKEYNLIRNKMEHDRILRSVKR